MRKEFFSFLICVLFFQNEKNPLSVFGLNMRTTSSMESLNSVLGRLIPKHPNIFKFIDGIKLHEFAKFRELLELSNNCPAKQLKRKKKIDEEREAKIKRTTDELLLENITPSEFLDAFSLDHTMLPHSGNFSNHCEF